MRTRRFPSCSAPWSATCTPAAPPIFWQPGSSGTRSPNTIASPREATAPTSITVRRTVILVGAVASRGEAMVLGDRVPEEPGCQKIGGAAGVHVALHGAEQLGNLRVRMLATEVVLMALERLDQGAVLEGVREPQPALVAGVGVQVDQHLVHAAELGVQHSLDLAVVQARQRPFGPAGKLRLDGERRPVSGVAVRVAQARERLVQGVPGRPQPVQVEGRRLDLAPRQSGEGLSRAFQGAQVTIAVLVLHDL